MLPPEPYLDWIIFWGSAGLCLFFAVLLDRIEEGRPPGFWRGLSGLLLLVSCWPFILGGLFIKTCVEQARRVS